MSWGGLTLCASLLGQTSSISGLAALHCMHLEPVCADMCASTIAFSSGMVSQGDMP